MTESEWTKEVCDKLKAKGAYVVALVGSAKQQSGLPDRMVFSSKLNKTTFIEFKGEHTPLKTIQRRVMAEINKRIPFTCFVFRQPGILEYCRFSGTKTVTVVLEYISEDELIDTLDQYINGTR